MTFDKIINRKNTGSVKWDMLKPLFVDKDILPMWIADMDFDNPKPVNEFCCSSLCTYKWLRSY